MDNNNNITTTTRKRRRKLEKEEEKKKKKKKRKRRTPFLEAFVVIVQLSGILIVIRDCVGRAFDSVDE